jgi:hypothetical protein
MMRLMARFRVGQDAVGKNLIPQMMAFSERLSLGENPRLRGIPFVVGFCDAISRYKPHFLDKITAPGLLFLPAAMM